MNYQVLSKQADYKGSPIIIRKNGEMFEFITVIDNQIYSSFIIARKSLLQKLLFRNYRHEQEVKIVNYVLNMAQSTIDTVLDNKKDKPNL